MGGALIAVALSTIAGGALVARRAVWYTALTLAAGVVIEPSVAIHHWLGPHDAFVFPRRLGFTNLEFAARWPYAMLGLAVLAVTTGATVAVARTRVGLVLHALRANPAAARGIGLVGAPPRRAILAASSFVTAVAGALFAEVRGGVNPHAVFAPALGFDIALLGALAGTQSAWRAPLVGLAYAACVTRIPLHPGGVAGGIVSAVEALVTLALVLRASPMRAAQPRPAPALAASGRA